MMSFFRVLAFLAMAIGTTLMLLETVPGLAPVSQSYSSISHKLGSTQQQYVPESDEDMVLLGVGKADITGPVVELNMMGYADTAQSGTGLRQRLYARAFIVGSPEDDSDRILYLVLDTQSGDTAIRNGILEGLKALGKEYGTYTDSNLALTGTHSHSGPGAWLNYLLPQITSKGFDEQSYQAIVDGTLLAIQRAHQSLTPGRLSFGQTRIEDASVNRSPYAYLANPKSERALYDDDVVKDLTLLKFEKADGIPMGILSWFPVHGTSLYQNNTLITGDNKGVAAYLLEESLKTINSEFVAGFSQANVGDTSPNILGAYCENTGLECRFNDSTCGGKTRDCHGRGPNFRELDQGTKSCFTIGARQFAAAKSLLDSPSNLTPIPYSTISSFHIFSDLSNYTFISPFNSSQNLQTCSAALGHGFAGGTTDGPGKFDFKQGTNDSDPDSPSLKNPLWRLARSYVHEPSPEQIICQHPKPILLDVGAATSPYAWTPNVVDIQVLRISNLLIIVAPGEATTMSGRRWTKSIFNAARSHLNISEPQVVVGGPANTYAHYIATSEEYTVQRYEGASTLYGPHTLAAYINLTLTYLPYLASADEVKKHLPILPKGPQPPVNTNISYSFINPVIADNPGFFKNFGDVLESPDPSATHKPGSIVKAKFIGANPRNNLRLEQTFAAVESFDPAGGKWDIVRTDRDWNLVYRWERTNTALGTSKVSIEWEIEKYTESGLYRLRYFGDSKSLTGRITAFEGVSGTFRVKNSNEGRVGGEEWVAELMRL